MRFPLTRPNLISRLFSSHSFSSPIHETLHRLIDHCTSISHLKQLHAQLILHRLTTQTQTLTLAKLISSCSLSLSLSPAADLPYAHLIFTHLHQPNKFMYNTLIRAYANTNQHIIAISLYYHMINSGLSPNEFTLPFVLKSCAARTAYWDGAAVHCQAVKVGIGGHVCVQNGVINVYCVFGMAHCARQVFDEMSDRSLVSWNSMIGGYAGVGCWEEAFRLFWEMRGFGVGGDKFTMVSLLSVCSQSCDLGLGRCLHCYVVVSGVVVDQILRNALLDMYGKCGCLGSAQMVFDQMSCKNVVSWTSMVRAYARHGQIEVAHKCFDQMPMKNVVSWNVLISCYVREGRCREALDLFHKMIDSGEMPDEATLVLALSACSQIGDLVIGKETHDYIRKSSTILTVTLCNSLLDMYAKCGAIETAMDIFTQMPEKNLVSWNIVIRALALHGHGSEAVGIFEQMQEDGLWPDEITFIGLLCACSHSGLLDLGRYYFERMKSVYRISPEIEHYACMVDLLGRRGFLTEAITLMKGMPMKPDIIVWGAMLGACRIHGNVDLAKLILKQLLELGIHGSGLYVLLANIFGEAQEWEDVKNIRKIIKDGGVIKSRAVSSVEIDGCVYEFIVDDNRHAVSRCIYSNLDQLTDHLKSLGYLPTAFSDIEEL